MAYSKVILNGTTLIDVTQKTVDANNLLSGYTALKNDGTDVTGSYTPQSVNLQSKSVSYTPSETAQSATVTPDTGYDGLDEVSVSVGAISSNYVGSGITRRSSSDLTASGATVTVPSGYYSAQASKAVASGTAGTPTATKGTVSNHAVSVTPSVTNTTGYITGGTKTGTAVSVSASELVSGTKSITENGTGIDVTNYASVDVNVSGGGGGAEQLYVLVESTGYGSTDVMIDGSYGTQVKAYYKTGLSSGALITVYTWGDYILDTVTGMTSGTTIPYTTVSRGTYTFTMPNESVYCSLYFDD